MPEQGHLQSHASYTKCGLGSDATDRLVQLTREEQRAASSSGRRPALFGAKITGGGSGGTQLTRPQLLLLLLLMKIIKYDFMDASCHQYSNAPWD